MKLSNEYIRGLVDGEGCFTFYKSVAKRGGKDVIIKIPAFAISMHERDMALLEAVRDHLNLKNRVYIFKPYKGDGAKRGNKATLVVREIGRLKDAVVPLFYKRLKGFKASQFENWLNNIGADPAVPESYKIIYRLHQCGFYDRNQRFND